MNYTDISQNSIENSDINDINIDMKNEFDITPNVNIRPDIYKPFPVRSNSSSDESNSSSNDIYKKPVMITVQSDIPFSKDNIQEENTLQDYTNKHFVTLSKLDLDRLQNQNKHEHFFPDNNYDYYEGNSPVLSILDSSQHVSNNNSNNNSNDNSDIDSDSDIRTDINQTIHQKNKYKKFKTHDIERYIKKFYSNYFVDKYANELDILSTFIKGQKNLYIQSKNITQQKLNLLVFPALLITACITFASPFFDCDDVNNGIISGLNAAVTLFISMISFLKYESSVEMFLLLATLFDNIETSLQLTSSKIMIMKKESEISQLILTKFNEVEDRITEYKLTNSVIIPPEVKSIFPIISHINIFSVIKKTEMLKRGLIDKLCDIKNEIQYIHFKWNRQDQINEIKKSAAYNVYNGKEEHDNYNKKEVLRLNQLYSLKEKVKNDVMELQSAYTVMDTIFNKEITYAEKNQNKWWCCLLCFYWKKNNNEEYIKELINHLSPQLKDIISPY